MDEKNSAQERYLDAAADAFMAQYGLLLEESVLEEAESAKDTEVPPSLDARCKELLRKESIAMRRKLRQKAFLRAAGRVAVVLVVFLVTFSVLFMNVEAIRIPIMNLFIEFRDTYMIISTQDPEELIVDTFKMQDPLSGIVPEGFEFYYAEGYSEILHAGYRNNNEGNITLFVQSFDNGNTLLDSEDAEMTRFRLQGHDAIMLVEDNSTILFWTDNKHEIEIILTASNIDSESVLSTAQDLSELLYDATEIFPTEHFYVGENVYIEEPK